MQRVFWFLLGMFFADMGRKAPEPCPPPSEVTSSQLAPSGFALCNMRRVEGEALLPKGYYTICDANTGNIQIRKER